jgi:hypothetical protein
MDRFAGHLTEQDALTRAKRVHVFEVLFGVPNLTDTQVTALRAGRAELTPPPTLTRPRMREILAWALSPERGTERHARLTALLKLIRPAGPAGPDRVLIGALFDETGVGKNRAAGFDPFDLVAAADVILGVDTGSGHEFVLFGRPAWERAAGDEGDAAGRVLRVELDQATDDLERMVALVRLLKGRDDYR